MHKEKVIDRFESDTTKEFAKRKTISYGAYKFLQSRFSQANNRSASYAEFDRYFFFFLLVIELTILITHFPQDNGFTRIRQILE